MGYEEVVAETSVVVSDEIGEVIGVYHHCLKYMVNHPLDELIGFPHC
jgi:hypothetical protein